MLLNNGWRLLLPTNWNSALEYLERHKGLERDESVEFSHWLHEIQETNWGIFYNIFVSLRDPYSLSDSNYNINKYYKIS